MSDITVQRVSGLSRDDFYSQYVRRSRPVIITDMTAGWRAASLWSDDYFLSAHGDTRVGTMTIRDEKCDIDTYSEEEDRRELLRDIIGTGQKGLSDDRRVIASPLAAFPEAIRQDYQTPLYCEQGRFLRSKIYIGPRGLVTPLHQDLPENLYALIRGRKTIILYPPSDRRYLYINSPFSRHPNFSQVDPLAPDMLAHPHYRLATPVVVHLEAGETLFIPSLWWHHFQNAEDSIAINFWWSYDWKVAITWLMAMYKKWLR